MNVTKHAHWGHDLKLLSNLERQNDRDRGRDLATVSKDGAIDLATLGELDNLKQALFLRFLSHQGDLAEVGHPAYGSRLFQLIGEPNTETNRNRAKMFVLQALAAEPRVAKVISIDVTTSPRNRAQVDIAVSLRPIDSNTELNLVFPFNFEGGRS